MKAREVVANDLEKVTDQDEVAEGVGKWFQRYGEASSEYSSIDGVGFLI